jgi:hypothetical protein
VALLAAFIAWASSTARAEGPPRTEGPWVVEASPDTVVIVNQRGDVTLAGDAEARVRACGLTPGCIAYWEEGIGPILIVGADDIAGGVPRQGSDASSEPPEPAP